MGAHMMRRLISVLLLVCVFFSVGQAVALRVPGLDEARVPVLDRSPAHFRAALPQAFGQVLVKVSGNAAVMTLPQIQNSLSHLTDDVVRYDYTVQPEAASQPSLMLHLVFDKKAVRHVLQQAGQSVWSADRPLTLVWLYQMNLGAPVLVVDPANTASQDSLKAQAHRRGVALLFPTMDLQDQSDLALGNTMAPPVALLREKAARYGVSSVLVGVITPASDTQADAMVAIHWRFLLNGSATDWETQGQDTTAALQAGINRLADRMANQYALIAVKHSQSTILMQVDEVNTVSDYASVLSALRHLSIVSRVAVRGVDNNALLLAVDVAGGAGVFGACLARFSSVNPQR